MHAKLGPALRRKKGAREGLSARRKRESKKYGGCDLHARREREPICGARAWTTFIAGTHTRHTGTLLLSCVCELPAASQNPNPSPPITYFSYSLHSAVVAFQAFGSQMTSPEARKMLHARG